MDFVCYSSLTIQPFNKGAAEEILMACHNAKAAVRHWVNNI